MHGEVFPRHHLHYRPQHGLHPAGRRGTDGFAERHLVTTEIEEPPRDAGHGGGRDRSLIRAVDHARDIAAHRNAFALRRRHHRCEALEALGDGAIRVALGKSLGRRREDRDFLGARGARRLEPAQVRHQHGVAHAKLALEAREHLGAVRHLGHPLR